MKVLAVRKIDDLGRLILPIELRRRAGMEEFAEVEMGVDEEGQILLRKLGARCIVCDQTEHLLFAGEKALCEACLQKFQREKESAENASAAPKAGE